MTKVEEKKRFEECMKHMRPIRDALDVINGKWKMMIIISIMHDNKRFREIERSIPKITSKVLAKELKDLEQHKLIKRTVYDDYPVTVEYTATEHTKSLEKLMSELSKWGTIHRKKIIGK